MCWQFDTVSLRAPTFAKQSHNVDNFIGKKRKSRYYNFFFCFQSAEVAAEHVEGGSYIGPEFLLGQVYDGSDFAQLPMILYRPVYSCVVSDKKIESR